jgi:hypothetical protein
MLLGLGSLHGAGCEYYRKKGECWAIICKICINIVVGRSCNVLSILMNFDICQLLYKSVTSFEITVVWKVN